MTSPASIILLLALGGAGYYAYKVIQKDLIDSVPSLSYPTYVKPFHAPATVDSNNPGNAILLPSGTLINPVDIPTFSFVPTNIHTSSGGSIFSIDVPYPPKNYI
jgi:hypothetical protein